MNEIPFIDATTRDDDTSGKKYMFNKAVGSYIARVVQVTGHSGVTV